MQIIVTYVLPIRSYGVNPIDECINIVEFFVERAESIFSVNPHIGIIINDFGDGCIGPDKDAVQQSGMNQDLTGKVDRITSDTRAEHGIAEDACQTGD